MTATVAAPTGNQFGVLLAIFLVITAATVVVLWVHERRWDRHEAEIAVHHEQLATLAGRIQSLADHLGVDVHDARDDSPQALARLCMCGKPESDSVHHRPQVSDQEHAYEPAPTEAEYYADAKPDPDTEEFPALPATVPDGIAIQVQSALLRPSPVPRGKSAEWVEEAIKGFNFSGRER